MNIMNKNYSFAMRLACEFGYKQAEKGVNLEMALLNFEKALAGSFKKSGD